MSFISEKDFNERVSDPRNLLNIFPDRNKNEGNNNSVREEEVEEFIKTGDIINSTERRETGVKGKVLGDKNIPDVIRDVITIQSNFAPVSDVARSWGVSPASVSNLKNGIPDRREGHEDNHRNIRAQQVLNNNVSKIRKVVEKKILNTLALITQEALENQDAKSLSVIAKNLSGVVGGLEGRDISGATLNVQTIFYSPETARLEDYELIKG
jgi:hypothetical protein